jgi:hypothetical protein
LWPGVFSVIVLIVRWCCVSQLPVLLCICLDSQGQMRCAFPAGTHSVRAAGHITQQALLGS